MNLNIYFDLTQTISKLQTRGFTRTFSFENNNLKCIQTNKEYTQKDLQIIEYHRFGNDKNHPQKSIIFAIVCEDGEQGYIISPETDNQNIKLLQFMDKVKIKPSLNSLSTTKKNSAA